MSEMSEITELSIHSCLNCGEELMGNYCSSCGQSARIKRITFKETFNSFLSSAFALEGPFLHTLWSLIRNPGKVFREFLAGKRKSYYQPVAFFVLLTAVHIITRAIIGYDPLEGQEFTQGGDPDGIEQNLQKAARFMVENINNILFILAFSIGVNFKLFFRKRYYLAEYTAIGFYIGGVYILFSTLIMLFNNFSDFDFKQLQLILLSLYIFYCSWSFFQSTGIWKMFKYLFIAVMSMFIYVIIGYGFSFLVVYFI